MGVQSVESLKRALKAAHARGDLTRARVLKAELDRVACPPKEKAEQPTRFDPYRVDLYATLSPCHSVGAQRRPDAQYQ